MALITPLEISLPPLFVYLSCSSFLILRILLAENFKGPVKLLMAVFYVFFLCNLNNLSLAGFCNTSRDIISSKLNYEILIVKYCHGLGLLRILES